MFKIDNYIYLDNYIIYQNKSRNNQLVFKFPNGYGASVIQIYDGLFEIAVLTFPPEGSWVICYDTPITDNTVGYLSEPEVYETLEQIYNLKRELTNENM